MYEKIDKYLKSKGLTSEVKKTVVQYSIDDLVAFSISGNKVLKVSFPLFKDIAAIGNKTSSKGNKQRDIFLMMTDGLENVDIKPSSPTATFHGEEELISFFKKYHLVNLAIDYSKFEDVNTDYLLKRQECDGLFLNYRANIKTEVEIMDDVFRKNEYVHKGLKLSKDDIVLDLGGNIGAFSCRNFRDVKRIIAFEPEQTNCSIFLKNIRDNKAKNILLFKKAVVGNDDKQRKFYVGRVPYYYSFYVTHNRKSVIVPCVNINDVVKKFKPTKMKVDIEGSEFEVLMNCNDFGSVDQIIFEYNFDFNKDLKNNFKNFDALALHLKNNGFDVSQLVNYSRSKNWAEVFLCSKL